MSAEDAYQTRQIQRELCRRYVDFGRVEVRMMHGVCYVRGMVTKLRNHLETDLEVEVEVMKKIIRQTPFVRDMVWEVEIDPMYRSKRAAGTTT